MEKKIIELIKANGPLRGAEIYEAIGEDSITLWQTCKRSKELMIRNLGTHYLRLDRRVKGFARLSPSIWREFLTYSVIGIAGNPVPIEQKAIEIAKHIEEISEAKVALAYRVVSGIASQLDSMWMHDHQLCFIIAGDIVYNMAHDVPRPERSTGKLVNGSDIDLVVIASDDFPEDLLRRLDDYIYREKYRLLITPHVNEEIDYIVKKLKRVREQVRFDTFKHMVACKIMHEGTFLYGGEELFTHIKTLLRQSGVTEKLQELEQQARSFRKNAETHLLRENPEKVRNETLSLFYPTEESEEFE